MNKKIFTQLYNERRSNAWLLIELLLVSVVLWYTVDTLFVTLTTYTDPKGFDITNTYNLGIGLQQKKSPDYIPNRTAEESNNDMRELVDRLRKHPQIEAVSVSHNSYPYNGSDSGNSIRIDTLINWGIWRRVTPDFLRVFRYRGTNGETPEQLAELLNEGTFMASHNFFQQKYGIDLNKFVKHSFTIGYDTIKHYTLVSALEIVRFSDFEQLSDNRSRSIVSLLPENQLEEGNELCIRVRDGVSPTFAVDLMKESATNYHVGNVIIH